LIAKLKNYISVDIRYIRHIKQLEINITRVILKVL